MHVTNCIVILFDLEIENADTEFHIEVELIEICEDLKTKLSLKSKIIPDNGSNVNTVTK